MVGVSLRAYEPADAECVNQLVWTAWCELADSMPQCNELAPRLVALTEQAHQSEVIVAEFDGQIVGAVGYVAAHQPKPAFFDPAWAIVRMLSVIPSARALGVGEQLLHACIDRAARDQAPLLALHTASVMRRASNRYARLGFEEIKDLPPLYGVPYLMLAKKIRH